MESNINDDICDNIETGVFNNELMTVDVDASIKGEGNLQGIRDNKNNLVRKDYRRVLVPANRMKPLKDNWPTIIKALVEHMKIQVKMNTKLKCVEMRTCETTEDVSALHKSEEFLKAFMCGFELQDAIAMLRLEDLYLESFEIKDGKRT
jgi:RNA-binding protein PNO1